MAYVIFDLDGTVIDTKHRYRNLPCGTIDLDYWRENCTPEKIAADTLLPLVNVMRRYYAEGHTVIICTARVFSQADFDYLNNNDIPYHYLLKREDGDNRGDAEMKIDLLDKLAVKLGKRGIADLGAIMFDDNVKVIEAMAANRVICFDAVSYNRNLRKGKSMPHYLDRLGLAA